MVCAKIVCYSEVVGTHLIRALQTEGKCTISLTLSYFLIDAGASLAVGTDTDAVAVRAASQNGVLNKFSGKWIILQCGPSIEDPDPLSTNPQGFLLPTEYDICIANILQVTFLKSCMLMILLICSANNYP